MKNTNTAKNLSVEETNIEVADKKSYRMACDAIVANAFDTGAGKIARIPCEMLHIDHYQRDEQAQIKNIAANWNEKEARFLIVSYRDGVFYVVDGRQRLAAAKLRGIYDVNCVVYTDMTYANEAIALADQNKYVTPISPYDQLHAKAQIGAQPYADIAQICENRGITLVRTKKYNAGECGSIAKLIDAYNRMGRDGFIWMLDTIEEVGWSASHDGYGSTVICALRNVWVKSNGLDMDMVKTRIAEKVNGGSPYHVRMEALRKFPRRDYASSMTEYFLGTKFLKEAPAKQKEVTWEQLVEAAKKAGISCRELSEKLGV